jgi:hypothetical protein
MWDVSGLHAHFRLILAVLSGSTASRGQRKPCEKVCMSNIPPYQQEGMLSFYPLSLVARGLSV